MKIVKIPRKRDIVYDSKEPFPEIYSNSYFVAHKLRIEYRLIPTTIGELNFIITLKENPNKYIFLYCFMKEPNAIFRFSYFINNEVDVGNKQILKTNELIDEEIALFHVMDFVKNYISINYEIV